MLLWVRLDLLIAEVVENGILNTVKQIQQFAITDLLRLRLSVLALLNRVMVVGQITAIVHVGHIIRIKTVNESSEDQ
jgi:hypothetical protein